MDAGGEGQDLPVTELPVTTTDIAYAAEALRGAHLVAFPTETVYGLGALADNDLAVGRVFSVKGRPTGHPLIVHLASVTQVEQWAVNVPPWALHLAHEAWPGPLTLIVPRASRVRDAVTGGQPTVGLRIPNHSTALALLDAVGTGVAAPSANPFGRVSPTSAAHVVADLAGRLSPHDVVLDGEPCGVGIESTIVLAIDNTPRLLRPGALSARDITSITGLAVVEGDDRVRASGTLPSHYSPSATVILMSVEEVQSAEPSRAVGVIAQSHVMVPPGFMELARPESTVDYAHDLYSALRAADIAGLSTVIAVPPASHDGDFHDGDPLALAITDRLRRAAHR